MKKRRVKLKPEVQEMFQELRRRFIEKFGREPGPDDPVIFDPDADTPQPISEEKLAKHLAEAAAAAGIEADKVYAISETGLIPTSRSPEEVKQEFKRAMDRYHKLKRQ